MLLEPLRFGYYSTYQRAQENLTSLGNIMRGNLAPRIEEFKEYDPNLRIRLAIEMYEEAKETDGEVSDFTSLFYLTSIMPENLKDIKIAQDIKDDHPDGIPISKMSVEEFLDRFCVPPNLKKDEDGIKLWDVKILPQKKLDELHEKVDPIVGEMVRAYNFTDSMIDRIKKELDERSKE